MVLIRRHVLIVLFIFSAIVLSGRASAQQVPDTTWAPPLPDPFRAVGAGPGVGIDEAHGNFHTAGGRYRPFADLLRRDGFRVEGWTAPFTAEGLKAIDILVISNPLHASNQGNWALPTPSAFTAGEVDAVREWVRGGGSLLLIADHMPFAGAADSLARAFGVEFRNGFAASGDDGTLIFRRSGGGLADHPLTRGRSAAEAVDSVATFTGSAFRPGPGAEPLLVLPAGTRSLEPDVAWEFTDSTAVTPVGGWCQGAVQPFGEGRIAIFGEAAMFSAQLAGPEARPVGMNSPRAPQNWRFLLNVLRWLAGTAE